jgi:hypothetical protein
MQNIKSGMIESAKRDTITAIKDTGDVVQAAVDIVTNTLGTTVNEAGKTGALVVGAGGNVAKAVIHGATAIGAHVGHAAKGTVIGMLRASKHIGAEAIDTVGYTAYALNHGKFAEIIRRSKLLLPNLFAFTVSHPSTMLGCCDT